MDFFKEDRAVISAVWYMMKLGFALINGRKTKTQLHLRPTATSAENVYQMETQDCPRETLNACLYDDGAMEPFCTSIPAKLLYPEVGGTKRFQTNATASTGEHTVFQKLNECLEKSGAMKPFRSMLDPELLQEASDDPEENRSAITSGISRTESDGCVSPTSSVYSTDLSSCLSNNLSHSRKQSWATSIDSLQEHDKGSQLPIDGLHVSATSDEVDVDSTFLSEYQHYHDLITIKSTASHCDTSKAASDQRETMNEDTKEPHNTARPDQADTEDSESEYSAHDEMATNEHDVANHFNEEMPQIVEESFAADESSLWGPTATGPGRDCFHCLPKALAPEFTVGAVCDDGDSSGDEHHEDSSEHELEEEQG
ncbi:hypothetical protein SLS53_005678 [Cytospora paraplurivora]|uniref:Uncharacterized protein n=1 Tax=Cytospora paraplurivora TaxID=2898453 RepID=A0AAN9YEU6_9PEZI